MKKSHAADHPSTFQGLMETARRAASEAYCPFSNFHVGAAARSGERDFQGCNVENASFGLTICAERSAIFAAVAAGFRRIDAMAISSPDINGDSNTLMPCGACRQVMAEFMSSGALIFVEGTGVFTLDQILPLPFGLRHSTKRDKILCSKPLVAVDVDNVIARTDEVMRAVIERLSIDKVALRYEDVVRFDYWLCRDSNGSKFDKSEWAAIHEAFSDPAVLTTIEPYPEVQSSLERLAQHFDIQLITSRLPHTLTATRQWLSRHNLSQYPLHYAKHLDKHRLGMRCFAAIEDDLDQAVMFALAGVRAFLIAHPWNMLTQNPLIQRHKDWPSLTEALIASL